MCVTKRKGEVNMGKEYVYTASGELVENTFGTYEEAYNNLVEHGAWGVILKHEPYDIGEEKEEDMVEVVYEYLPHKKPR